MIKVDTFFDGRYICENLGMYYIVKDGDIISPPFSTLKDAQNNAWKYQEQEDNNDIEAEVTILKQQLEIAVKMLEKIRHTEDWRLAHEALVQIRGVR